MIKTNLIVLAALVISSWGLQAQLINKDKGLESINEQAVKAQLEFLASDWTEGRETGTQGAYMAADYIASMFKIYGLEPGGDYKPVRYRRGMSREERESIKPQREYFQKFNLIEYSPGEIQECELRDRNGNSIAGLKLAYNVDFSVSSGQQGINFSGPVVFVGYGLNTDGYNEFEDVDVRGKIIMRMSGYPGHLNPESNTASKFVEDNAMSRYMIERGKNAAASEAGAVAVIEVGRGGRGIRISPSNAGWRFNEDNWEGTEPFRQGPGKRLSRMESLSSGLTSLNLSERAMEYLLKGVDIDFDEFEKNADKKAKPASFELPGKEIYLNTTVESRIIQAQNVIGILEGNKKDECIVLGAHYDHLGVNRNFIYNGSDDNASGTVGIMTIARAMLESGQKPEYTMVFCAWTAEEKGLIGSAYYADNPLINDIKCYMNYDMISRVDPDDPEKNKCDFTFTNTVPAFKELTEKHIQEYNINLDMEYKGSEMPVGGSDYSSFSRKGIPIFLLHGKFTPDYHHYTDHSDRAEIPYMTDIIKVGYLNLFELANNYQW